MEAELTPEKLSDGIAWVHAWIKLTFFMGFLVQLWMVLAVMDKAPPIIDAGSVAKVLVGSVAADGQYYDGEEYYTK